MKSHVFLASIALFAVSGCASEKFVGRPDLKVVTGTVLPPPSREDLILQQRSYVVGPLDKVTVDVYGVPELSRTVQVDASGTIALPLVGEVRAAGKSPTELARALEASLRKAYVRNPQVIVNLDTASQVVTVDGQVTRAGLYPITGRMTLMRAIASAQGLTDYADTKYVVVFRRVNNQPMAALYDLRAIRSGIYDDPEIYPNDVIYVGESGGRRVFQAIIQSAPLLTAPVIALLN